MPIKQPQLDKEMMSKHGNSRPRLVTSLASLTIFLAVLCPINLFLLESPRYLKLPIQPPGYIQDEVGTWDDDTTYSIQTWWPPIPPTYARYFIWRKEATILYDNVHGIDSWQSIVTYFDNVLSEQGWERDTASIPQYCNLHLPESEFLRPGREGSEEGYVTYREKGYEQFVERSLVCIAIWPPYKNDDGTINSFRMVLITSKPSPLTYLSKRFELP